MYLVHLEKSCQSCPELLNLPDRLHPCDAALEMFVHALRIGVMNVAVTRQHPLEFITQKFFHRSSLLRPRIPGNTAKSRECFSRRRPCEVIPGEQKLVPVKKDNVTSRMSRDGNYEQVIIQLDRVGAVNYLLNPQTCSAIIGMHQSFTAEFLTKQLVIGDVVFVS